MVTLGSTRTPIAQNRPVFNSRLTIHAPTPTESIKRPGSAFNSSPAAFITWVVEENAWGSRYFAKHIPISKHKRSCSMKLEYLLSIVNSSGRRIASGGWAGFAQQASEPKFTKGRMPLW